MRKAMRIAIGAVIILGAATSAVAPATAKSQSSCYDAYGHYGYSFAYCQHDPYGRSSPPDRYKEQNPDLISRNGQELGRLADREQYLYGDRQPVRRDRDDSKRYGDQDRDRG